MKTCTAIKGGIFFSAPHMAINKVAYISDGEGNQAVAVVNADITDERL